MSVSDQAQQKQVDRILGEPDLFPDEFKSWIVKWIQDNANLKLPATALPSIESTKYVGVTGQPEFLHSWVAYEAGFEVPGFYKDVFNRVYLCGLLKDGSIGNAAFVLPSGYRPKARQQFSAVSDGDTGFRVDVLATGDVIPISGTNPYISLSGISFRAFG